MNGFKIKWRALKILLYSSSEDNLKTHTKNYVIIPYHEHHKYM